MSDPDVELALRACDGDELATARLLRRFEGLLWSVVRGFYAPGLTDDDLMQEARIALVRATVSFDSSRGVPFAVFAKFAVRRTVIDAVRTATRGRQAVVSYAVPLDEPDEDGLTLAGMLAGGDDPLARLLERERLAAVLVAFDALTECEQQAVRHVLAGRSYRGDKRLDNALQRARRKLRAAVDAA